MLKLKLSLFLGLILFLLNGCVQSGGNSIAIEATQNEEIGGGQTPDAGSGGGLGGSSGAAPGQGGVESGETIDLSKGQAELRHIIDPIDGSFQTKVTIPKDFNGHLYLSGLNITSLNDKQVKVRFNFGQGLEPITVEATVARVKEGGITPKSDIEVLWLTMLDRPFDQIRLLYDLYDYNDYRDDFGIETKEPVSDPLNGKLYCRGLRLEHDPTFSSSTLNTACDEPGERCLYAYADVFDSGLVDSDGQALTPTQPQMDVAGSGYASEASTEVLKKCLPDNNSIAQFTSLMKTNIVGNVGLNTTGISRVDIGGETYTYNGPFRPNNYSNWQINRQAVVSPVNSNNEPTGLFQYSYSLYDPLNPENYADGGFRSFLFPRAMKRSLSTGVEYFGALGSDIFGEKTLTSMSGNGDTEFMNGCSARATSANSEGISACNVTGTIEIITVDSNGNESVLSSTTELKLQLIRASKVDYTGHEVLHSALNSCETNNMCGSDECCYNNRCWSKTIVSQCIDDNARTGNLSVGQACQTDYECSSLCCQSGVCAVHEDDEVNPSFCSKSPGQSCVAEQWCRQENVQQCFIVKTKVDSQGNQECARRCYNVPTFGECRNNVCIPPEVPPIPDFDPNNPDCSSAIDPPEL
ncbi:MAG: hypothetical protein ACPGJV_13040 [Bacteriovoracaceae bacterium]